MRRSVKYGVWPEEVIEQIPSPPSPIRLPLQVDWLGEPETKAVKRLRAKVDKLVDIRAAAIEKRNSFIGLPSLKNIDLVLKVNVYPDEIVGVNFWRYTPETKELWVSQSNEELAHIMQKNIVIEKIMTRKTIFAQVWLKKLRESLTQNKNIIELLNFYNEEIAPHEPTVS